MTPHELYLNALRRNLNFWHNASQPLTEARIISLAPEADNIYQALDEGLDFPETRAEAARFATLFLPFVEYHGFWYAWMRLFEKALGQTIAEPEYLCKTLYQLGFLLLFTQHTPEAIQKFEAAEQLARQTQYDYGLAYASMGLCNAYNLLHQYGRAETFGQTAIQYFQKAQASPLQNALAFNLMGMVYHNQQKYAAAEDMLREALKIRRTLENVNEYLRALGNLAITYREMKKYAEAQACYEEAIPLLNRSPNTVVKFSVQNSLGHLYFDLGEFAKAEQIFLKMDTDYLQQAGHYAWLARRENNLGEVYLKQNRLDEAEGRYRNAVEYWQLAGRDEVEMGNSFGSLGEVFAKQGRKREAIPIYEEAIGLLQKYPENLWAKDRCGRLGKQLEAVKG